MVERRGVERGRGHGAGRLSRFKGGPGPTSGFFSTVQGGGVLKDCCRVLGALTAAQGLSNTTKRGGLGVCRMPSSSLVSHPSAARTVDNAIGTSARPMPRRNCQVKHGSSHHPSSDRRRGGPARNSGQKVPTRTTFWTPQHLSLRLSMAALQGPGAPPKQPSQAELFGGPSLSLSLSLK